MSGAPAVFPFRPSALGEEAFADRFGAVYEHSPWVARETFRHGLGPAQDDVAGLAQALAATVDGAGRDRQLVLLRAHPELAGKAAGELSRASDDEQASAGIDRCSAQEQERFRRLNDAYRTKFGFPFIIAVRGRSRADILAAFERRLGNDGETEFRTALAQVHRIARLRLEAIAGNTDSTAGEPPGGRER